MNRNTNWHDELKASVLNDSEALAEYEAFKLQLKLADDMKHLRSDAHLTQEDMAEKLHTTKSAIARLESAGGRGRHSPSIKTVAKYAAALGCTLELKFKAAH